MEILLRAQTKRLEEAGGNVSHRDDLARQSGRLQKLGARKPWLFGAVEEGLLPLADSLRERMRHHDTSRQVLLAQIARLRPKGEVAPDRINDRAGNAFCAALGEHLLEDTPFAKAYPRILVDEIRLDGKSAVMRGSCGAVGASVAEKNLGTPPGEAKVPRFVLCGEP